MIQVPSEPVDVAGRPTCRLYAADKGFFALLDGRPIAAHGRFEQVPDVFGAEEHPNDGMTIGKELRGEGALPASNADELIHGVSLDLLRLSEVLSPESHDVRPALPIPGKGDDFARSFSKNRPVRDPISAAQADSPVEVA